MIDDKNEIIEYSISPNTGRIKKKIRYRKKKSFFSSKRMKKYMEFGLLILLAIIFLLSVVFFMRPGGEEMQRMKYIDKNSKK
ncbi:MAG: hypothetical protein JJE25_06275 [Bacteroidia bacterium]|nr:hypothetical protein [Bacteroidia bacterium]